MSKNSFFYHSCWILLDLLDFSKSPKEKTSCTEKFREMAANPANPAGLAWNRFHA